jgi:hypothetical protein
MPSATEWDDASMPSDSLATYLSRQLLFKVLIKAIEARDGGDTKSGVQVGPGSGADLAGRFFALLSAVMRSVLHTSDKSAHLKILHALVAWVSPKVSQHVVSLLHVQLQKERKGGKRVKAFMLVSIIGNFRNTCIPAITHKYKHTLQNVYTYVRIHSYQCVYTIYKCPTGNRQRIGHPRTQSGSRHGTQSDGRSFC